MATPILLFALLVGVLYWQQDRIVAHLIDTFNENLPGEITIDGSHISPFHSFPHITVDLEHVRVWEGKNQHGKTPILEVADIHLGFDLWTIISGQQDIHSIEVEKGKLDIVLHEDGTYNIVRALSNPDAPVEDVEEEFQIHLQKVTLNNIDIHKYQERDSLDIEAYVKEATATLKTSDGHTVIELQSQFLLNVIDRGDTTFLRHKHFKIDTHLDYREAEQLLTILPSEVVLEHGVFGVDGTLDIGDSLNLDLKIHGNKPNFDLFFAFAPEELIPVLERYENAGQIYFEGQIKGKSTSGIPAFAIDFGCKDAYFKNTTTNNSLEELRFTGHLSNTLSDAHDLSAMEFSIQGLHAKPAAGFFDAAILVRNFEEPDIDLTLNSDFNLDFLSRFVNFVALKDLGGRILLQMKFHDIIDLEHPERAITQLNEAYFAQLTIEDLTFAADRLPLPIDTVNAKVHMEGHAAKIDYLDIRSGSSDLHIDGVVSDLPAIIHHSDQLIDTRLNLQSHYFDLKALTAKPAQSDTAQTGFDEQISDFRMKLDFKSTARALTESKHLPRGEFLIEDLYAKLAHYPHALHDFHADIFIEDEDLVIQDLTGEIDSSDFHFHGKLHDYAYWFADSLKGDTRIEFDLNSDHLRLEDIFSYRGKNYVPEDYRHEELRQLKLHGLADLHFQNAFQSADLRLTKVNAKLKVHPLPLERFNGRIHYEDEHIQIDTLFGKIGQSTFTLDLNYYLGDNEAVRKRDNHLGLHANVLNLDELLDYHPPAAALRTRTAAHTDSPSTQDHEKGFNIYDLPFTPMTFDIDVGQLDYGRYHLKQVLGKFRTEADHHVLIDTLRFQAAGGSMAMNGVFDGRDRNRIYLDPVIHVKGIDLDQFLFKFENFGQDFILSDQLHGRLTATITGHIHVHPDLVPKVDDSQLKIAFVVNDGRLVKFGPLMAMSEYFGDKNLASVQFDSLRNTLEVKGGSLYIPNMTLNTSLGHLDFSGTQQMGGTYDMTYYVRVPMKMVTQLAKENLFGKKNKEEAEQAADAAAEDEVVYKDQTEKRIRYLNIKITGNLDAYKFSIGKDPGVKKRNRPQS